MINDSFLLSSKYAEELYSSVKNLPIIDYHCHIPAREIAQDVSFSDLTELMLGHDHYKWRIMRATGTPEAFITGDAPAKEKFIRYAHSLEYAVGNPLYHWTALELKRVFGINDALTEENAAEIFDHCTAELRVGNITARSIMKAFNVELICTTDDVADTLEHHKKIRDDGFDVKVLPTFRPDRFLGFERLEFPRYMRENGISSLDKLCDFMRTRLDFFCENGCVIADHGLDSLPRFSGGDVNEIFERRVNGGSYTQYDADAFKTYMLTFFGEEYASRGLAMQLHMGVLRNNNSRAFEHIGADGGFDSPDDKSFMQSLSHFLDFLDRNGRLPRTVLYSLNPNDNTALDTMAGNFFSEGVRGKVQHGSAWWFNDHRNGIRDQLTSLASVGVLGNFVGMLTDSRSLVSYTRHEYFRRILCDFLASFVLDGLYPASTGKLTEIARDISYYNTLNYFGFETKKKG